MLHLLPKFRWPNVLMDVTRATLMTIVFALGMGMIQASGASKAFGNLVSLVGGLTGFLLGFIIPSLLHLEANQWRPKYGTLSVVLHVGLILLGLLLTGVSTYYTIKGMV